MWNTHPVFELIPVGPQDIAYLVGTDVHLFSPPYLSAQVPQDPTKIEVLLPVFLHLGMTTIFRPEQLRLVSVLF